MKEKQFFSTRRSTANARERNRMRSLNQALDRLRSRLPPVVHQNIKQKLSKIETLKAARNYIYVLSEALAYNTCINRARFHKLITNGLSQNTSNLIARALDLSPAHTMSYDNRKKSQQLRRKYYTNGMFEEENETTSKKGNGQTHSFHMAQCPGIQF